MLPAQCGRLIRIVLIAAKSPAFAIHGTVTVIVNVRQSGQLLARSCLSGSPPKRDVGNNEIAFDYSYTGGTHRPFNQHPNPFGDIEKLRIVKVSISRRAIHPGMP